MVQRQSGSGFQCGAGQFSASCRPHLRTDLFYHLLIWRLCLGVILALPTSVLAAGWPEGYIVHKGTQSPDDRYGIAVPNVEPPNGATMNYLADLKSHQVLGEINCGDYFENENHHRLEAVWAPDSKYCVVVYEERFGFGSIAIVEPKRSGLIETQIEERIEKPLKVAAGEEGQGSVYFRFAADRKLLVRALYYTGNPKGYDEKTRFARFEGTFDFSSGKWTKAEARRIKFPKPDSYLDLFDDVAAAYSNYTGRDLIVSPDGKVPDDFIGTIVSSDKEKSDYIDRQMNQVYQGVRAVLPPERFEQVRKDQVAWLKKRDVEPSVAGKCQLMEARIKALQDLLW